MNFRIIASVATLFLWGSLALVPASAQVGAAPGAASAPGSHHGNEAWDWYQGERGHWRQDKQNGQWRWLRAKEAKEANEHRDNDDAMRHNNDAMRHDNDRPWDWYQGHKGRWQNEHGGWHFHSQELVCNNNGTNCRRGAEIPSNGEGMVSVRNPKWFWHCDSDGHNCNWAKRPGM